MRIIKLPHINIFIIPQYSNLFNGAIVSTILVMFIYVLRERISKENKTLQNVFHNDFTVDLPEQKRVQRFTHTLRIYKVIPIL